MTLSFFSLSLMLGSLIIATRSPRSVPRVGQIGVVDVRRLHARDGVEHELGLGWPPAIERRLAGLGPGRDHVDGHAVVTLLGKHVERGLENVAVARCVERDDRAC